MESRQFEEVHRMSRRKKRQQSEAVIHQNVLTEERLAFV